MRRKLFRFYSLLSVIWLQGLVLSPLKDSFDQFGFFLRWKILSSSAEEYNTMSLIFCQKRRLQCLKNSINELIKITKIYKELN